MDRTILRRWVESALDNMGQDPEDVVREDYSGRGMYGDECLGFTLNDSSQIAMLAVELTRQAMYEAVSTEPAEGVSAKDFALSVENDANTGIDIVTNLFDAAREDSMGRGAIVYFPGWTLVED